MEANQQDQEEVEAQMEVKAHLKGLQEACSKL